MGNSDAVDLELVMTREVLQGLYAAGAETVHVLTDVLFVSVQAQVLGEADPREISLPAGHYLIARVAQRPTESAGLFGVRAPRLVAARKSRGQSRGQP